MDTEFSIIVPTLNSEKFLVETIESLKDQANSISLEIIFVDGGSTDNTLEIIKNFNQNNIKKKIIFGKIGLSHAINAGLKIVDGKYLSYLNSDDILHKNALLNIKNTFENKKNVNWIVGYCENIGNKKFLNRLVNVYKGILLNKLNFNILCINNIISQPSVFWKYEFFNKVGYFDESLKYNMDYDMWLRMFKLYKPEIINLKISSFRRHADSLSHKFTFQQFKEKFRTMRKYKNSFIISILHIFISSIILLIYKLTNY